MRGKSFTFITSSFLILIVVFSLISIFEVKQAKATSTYYLDIGDASTSTLAPDTNYGYLEYLTVKNYSTTHLYTFIKFDISTLPSGVFIDSVQANLSKYYTYWGGTIIVKVNRVNGTWDAGTITWNNQPPVYSEYVTMSCPSQIYYIFNLTSIFVADSTISFRFISLTNANLDTRWDSDQCSSPDQRPRLLITYHYIQIEFDIKINGKNQWSYTQIPITLNYTNYYFGENCTLEAGTFPLSVTIPSNLSSFLFFDFWDCNGSLSIEDEFSAYTNIIISDDGWIILNLYQPLILNINIEVDTGKLEFLAKVILDSISYSDGTTITLADGIYDLSCIYDSNYNFTNWEVEGNLTLDDADSQTTLLTVSGNGTLTLWLKNISPLLFYLDRSTAFIGLGAGLGFIFLPLLGAILLKREDDLFEKIKIIFICFIVSLVLGCLFISWVYM